MNNRLLVLKRFNKKENLHNQEKIIEVLKALNRPVSFDAISIISDLRKDKLSQNLKRLSNAKLVKKVYCRKTSFWVICDG